MFAESVPDRFPVPHSIPHSVPHSVPHSAFESFTRLFVAFWKFHTYSTNLHTQGHKSSEKHFWRNFPIFQKNLHCPQNLKKKWFCWDFEKSYPLILWQLIKISVLFQKSKLQTLPIWRKIIFGKFLHFPEKLTLCAKFEQKWFCWDFEVLPPDFVRINQNFSPIPQIFTPDTINLTEKNFVKVSQFSRKTYIVCKIWTKMVLLGFWSLTPWFCEN